MNFFENEDRARRKTSELMVLFVISVIFTVVGVNVAVYGLYLLSDSSLHQYHRVQEPFDDSDQTAAQPIQTSQLLLGTTAITLLIIFAGSAYKTLQLRGGGPTVAQLVGGRPIIPNSTDPQEKILRDVVEEMSIASGVPMPRVFILDREDGINAFAAGHSSSDAVIVVTHGAMTLLSRDELQGVIAHEFSHILNGDMKLNLRTMCLLHGILVISLTGYVLFRVVPYTNTRNSKGSGAILALLLLGVVLAIVGWIGHVCAGLIQAAISRQREFLADASAVQFTRNPNGIANALKKLGKYSEKSRVYNAQAIGAAHMFFGEIAGFSFSQLMSTHPPIPDRIRAIDPTWDGKFDPANMSHLLQEYAGKKVPLAAEERPIVARIGEPLHPMIQSAGNISPQHLIMAAGLLAAIPDDIAAPARDPFSARAVVFALLISDDPAFHSQQFAIVQKNTEPACVDQLNKLLPQISVLDEAAHLTLLNQTLPALRRLSPPQSLQFRETIKALIEADGKVTLFEYTLHRMIEKQLRPPDAARAPIQFFAVDAVAGEASLLLSALAAASSTDPDRVFGIGAARFNPDKPLASVKVGGLASIDAALQKMSQSSPAVKQRFIDAAAHTVTADGEVNIAEAELLRAMAITLDVPLPPLVSG
jgi:Zn-dependent protease with chaperone function